MTLSNEIYNNLENKSALYFGPFNDNRVAVFHVNKKRRNLFFTVTDLTGAVISAVSSKLFMANRKKRYAPRTVELIVLKLAVALRAYQISAVRLFVKMNKSFVTREVVSSLLKLEIKVTMVMDLVPMAHNGCRKKKRRRL